MKSEHIKPNQSKETMPLPLRVALSPTATAQQVLVEASVLVKGAMRWEQYHRYGPGFEKTRLAFRPAPENVYAERAKAVRALTNLIEPYQQAGLNPEVITNLVYTSLQIPQSLDAQSMGNALSDLAVAYAKTGQKEKMQAIMKGEDPITQERKKKRERIYLEDIPVMEAISEQLVLQGKHDNARATIKEAAKGRGINGISSFARLANFQEQHGFKEEAQKTDILALQAIDSFGDIFSDFWDKDAVIESNTTTKPAVITTQPFYSSMLGFQGDVLFAHSVVAEEYIKGGRNTVAQAIFNRGISYMARAAGDEKRGLEVHGASGAIYDYALTCAEGGNIHAAEIAKQVFITHYQPSSLRKRREEIAQELNQSVQEINLAIAKRFAIEHNFSEAEKYLLDNPLQNRQAWETRSVLLEEQGRITEAVDMVKQIEGSFYKKKRIREISFSLAKKGDVNQAFHVLDQLDDTVWISPEKEIDKVHIYTLAHRGEEAITALSKFEIRFLHDAVNITTELIEIAKDKLVKRIA